MEWLPPNPDCVTAVASEFVAAVRRGFEVDLDRSVEAEVMDAAFVGLGHLDAPAAGVEQEFADLRDLAGPHRGEAADGIDILLALGQPRVDRLAHLVEYGAPVRLPAPAFTRSEGDGRFFAMLIL